jgi:hypothetical protein
MFQIEIVDFNNMYILRYVLILFTQWGIFNTLYQVRL